MKVRYYVISLIPMKMCDYTFNSCWISSTPNAVVWIDKTVFPIKQIRLKLWIVCLLVDEFHAVVDCITLEFGGWHKVMVIHGIFELTRLSRNLPVMSSYKTEEKLNNSIIYTVFFVYIKILLNMTYELFPSYQVVQICCK